jgi:hypothetical protein
MAETQQLVSKQKQSASREQTADAEMGADGLITEFAYQKRSAYRELDKDGRLENERRKNFKERLWMGAFGGIALLGPMLLMVLKPSRTTS